MSNLSTDGRRNGHVRRTSEPTELIFQDLAGSDAMLDRRQQLERHWSLGRLSGPGVVETGSVNTSSSPPVVDLFQLQQSWTNVDRNDFFGGESISTYGGDIGLSRTNSFASADRPEPLTGRLSSNGSCAQQYQIGSDGNAISSQIRDAARITDWDKVLELSESHPEWAKYMGSDRWTALHHACNRRCPYANVVEALIRAYPEALLKEEEKGWLPLHYACRFKAPRDVVYLLLHMHPDMGRFSVKKRDRQGRTPLYYAVRYEAPPGVVGLLLEVDPSVVLEVDQQNDSPLALVWDSWAEKLEGKRVLHAISGGFPDTEERTPEEQAAILRQRLNKESKLKPRWNKANMLLKAAFGFPVEDEGKEDSVPDEVSPRESETEVARTWRILHATCAVKCHLSLFLLAIALHPEQAREMDQGDLRPFVDSETEQISCHQTALHLAAASNASGEAAKTIVIRLLSLNAEAVQVQDGLDGSLPLHLMVENPRKQDWMEHASLLYHFYPWGVHVSDHNGRLPLHRACAAITHVERETEDEISRSTIIQLVRAFPQAASHADNAGCLPLHLIAMKGKVWDQDVEAVLNASRNATHVRTGPSWHNRLPIHLAAANLQSKESLILRLSQLHPRGAFVVDAEGKLPFHLLCENGKEWDAGVSAVYDAFPDAVRRAEANRRGWYPLHLAASSPHSSAALIAKLIELHPAAATMSDLNGRQPLHLACEVGTSWLGGLELLFDANPTALSTRDDEGLLPFHIAALRYCSQAAETTLRESMNVENMYARVNSGYSSIKEEEEADAREAKELDILFQLLRADPTVLPHSV